MKTLYGDIIDFHKKFGLEYEGQPRHLPEDLDGFRTKFMGEELAEYMSTEKRDHEEFAHAVYTYSMGAEEVPLEKKLDALVDLVYVAIGTAYLHGFDFDEAWRRVHEANMKKIRATHSSQSARGSVHDVVKPEGWTAPDLSDLVAPRHVFIKPEQDLDFAP